MAQKNKVPVKSPAKSKPKAQAAPAAKPARKVETRTVVSKKPVKGKPVTKAASQAKPTTKSHATPAKVAKQVQKSSQKSLVKADSKAAAAAKPQPAKSQPAKIQSSTSQPAKQPLGKPTLKAAVKSTAVPAAKPPVAAIAAPATQPTATAKPAVAKPVASSKPMASTAQAKPAHAPAAAPTAAKAAASVVSSGPVLFGTPAAARAMPSALPKPAMRTYPAQGMTNGSGGPAVPRDLAQKAVDARQQQVAGAMAGAAAANGVKKPVTARHGFKINESIVYPAHGVGRIIGIEEQEIAGMLLELFVIQFEKDKMTLKVPSGKLQTVGMRKLAEDGIVSKAMETLKGRARVKRTMWSRRAQEYEAKINSGDLVSIAEVVRDLYRSESQPEQSYSERQLYEAALDRMAREIAAVSRIDERGAVQRITEVLAKSAKGRRAAEVTEPIESEADGDGETDAKAA